MKEFKIKGVTFLDIREYTPEQKSAMKTSPEKVLILKDSGFVKLYENLSQNVRIDSIFEFGIAKGGSAVLHSLLFNPSKYVAIDIEPESEDILQMMEKLDLKTEIKLYFNTSQDDKEKITEIIQKEFPEGIDLIIDDASHLFDLTLRSFEIAFPYLKPNGFYIIEDWGWAHWRRFRGYEGLPALSQIAFLLIMMHASFPELIRRVSFERPAFMLIQKGHMKVLPEFFAIKNFINVNDFRQMTYLNYTFLKDFLLGRKVFIGGNVDVCNEERIAGWILDSSGAPAHFGIRINGKLVYENKTNVERKDIKQIYGVSYNAGFDVKLSEIKHIPTFNEISIEVFHIPSGVVIPGNYRNLKINS